MAFDYFQQDEDEKNGDQSGQPKNIGSESPITTGTQNQAAQPGGQPGGTSSGSFTNLQKYLDANSSLKFGQKIAGRVEGQVGEAEKNIADTGTQFKSKVDQSATPYDQQLIDSAKSDPRGVAADQAKSDAFAKMRDANYAGPKTLSDDDELYSKASGSAQKANELATTTGTEGGRKAYLDQNYGAGAGRYDYSAGQKKLDQYLIQNDPGSREQFEALAGRGQKAANDFSTLKDSLNSYAGQKAADTSKARQDSRASIGLDDAGNFQQTGPIATTMAGLQQKAQQAQQQKQSEYQALTNALSGYKLDPGQFTKTGLTEGEQTYGVNPNSYLKTGANPEAGDVVSQDDQATVAALAKLAGKENTFLPDASRAGSYDPNKANTFDKLGFESEIARQKPQIEAKVQERDQAKAVSSNISSTITRVQSGDDSMNLNSPVGVTAGDIGGLSTAVSQALQALGMTQQQAQTSFGSNGAFLNYARQTLDQRAAQANNSIPSNWQQKIGRA